MRAEGEADQPSILRLTVTAHRVWHLEPLRHGVRFDRSSRGCCAPQLQVAVPRNSWRMTSAGTADLRAGSAECTNPPTIPGTPRHVGLGVCWFLQVGYRHSATYGWVSQRLPGRQPPCPGHANLRAQSRWTAMSQRFEMPNSVRSHSEPEDRWLVSLALRSHQVWLLSVRSSGRDPFSSAGPGLLCRRAPDL